MSLAPAIWLLLALFVGGLPSQVLGAALAPASRPNFVIVLADDLGYGDLGCQGHPTIRTPRIDRLAAEGLRFTQFYAAAEVCTPSRVGLLTGRLPIRGGLHCGARRVLFPDSKGGIADEETTLAEALVPLGYHAACIGKWHLGHEPRFLPTHHGFDRYFGIPYSNDMSPAHSAGGKLMRWPATPLVRDLETIEHEPDQRLLTARYTDEAIAFLRAEQAAQSRDPDRRFLLYLPHTMPHVPLFASDRFQGRGPRGLYGDVVEELDHSVGRLVDELEQLALAANTLVLFTSDNGPWIEQGNAGGSAGLLRSGKGSTWEGGYRVPAVFYWPGRIPAGGTTTELASALDVFATCVSLAGGAAPADRALDGGDLSPVLLGSGPGPRQTVWFYRGPELFALRQGPWKLHQKTQAGYGQAQPDSHDPPLLYQLDHDPAERIDVAAAHPEIVARLVALADQQRRAVPPAPSVP